MATEAFVSDSSSATSGYASDTFKYGTTVYGIVKMLTSDAATYDLASAGWVQTYSNGQYS
jgi:hypothetical protein